MTEAEEGLAAELNLTGGSAWNQLHGDVTARLTADVDGERRCRSPSCATSPSTPTPASRTAAYDAELAAWDAVAVPLAAAMNGIKGEANVAQPPPRLGRLLAPALLDNAVDRATLDAMQAAVVASLPDFRRYLRAKARLLGHGRRRCRGGTCSRPSATRRRRRCTWDEAVDHVARRRSRSYSPSLAALAERAFAERWIDAEPRDGKRGGAFCMSVRGDESRVLLNFDGTFDSVSTLAHELGHAYHNTNLADRTRDAAPDADGAGRDRVDLLRDDPRAGGLAAADATTRAPARAARHRPHGRGAGRGRHPLAVPVRARGVRAASRPHAVGRASCATLMPDAQRATYGDGLDPSALTRTCGR